MLILFGCFFLTLVLIVGLITNAGKESKYKKLYQDALRGTDRVEALKYGRLYYGAKNGNGRCSAADEQAITNDLSTMRRSV